MKKTTIIYIKSFDAKAIRNKNGNYSIDTSAIKDQQSLYGNQLSYSMDTIQLQKVCKHHKIPFCTEKKLELNGVSIKRYCCDVIINVSFESKWQTYLDIPEDEQVQIYNLDTGKLMTRNKKIDTTQTIDNSELREDLYINGFECDGKHYVEFKRSSSKSRQGEALFILEELYDDMMRWSHMNIKFEEGEEVDLCALRAYESLTASGIEDVVPIKLRSILLIDDYISSFPQLVSNTKYNDSNVVITVDEEITVQNNIWDGESLLDASIFEDANRSNKGMMLLRNNFFKSCAFNTNIQQYFRDSNIKYVYDMFGGRHNADSIKMITTPSSLKMFKFDNKFGNDKKAVWDYWVRNAETEFGIVKSEKPSHFSEIGDINQMSYQYVNSLPMTKDEVKQLAKFDLEYIKKLKYDDETFLMYINPQNRVSMNREWIYNFCTINQKFLRTSECKQYRKDIIKEYTQRVMKGKLKIEDTDYCVIVGNPYEMLQAAGGVKSDKRVHPLNGWEISRKRLLYGQPVTAFRSPHICAGNVISAVNQRCDVLDKYFNFSDNIAVVNSIDTDIMNRGQGLDFDSDSILVSANPLLVKKGIECRKYLTPVNSLPAEKTPRHYTRQDRAAIDNALANNCIGKIVNLSQILNSYYWHRQSQDASDEELHIIYNNISQLSTLSQVEIDRAKKAFAFKTDNVLKKIRKCKDIYDNEIIKYSQGVTGVKHIDEGRQDIIAQVINADYMISSGNIRTGDVDKKAIQKFIKECFKMSYDSLCEFCDKIHLDVNDLFVVGKKQIRPSFFKSISNSNSGFEYKHFNCPMDYLADVLIDERDRRDKNIPTVPMSSIFTFDIASTANYDRRQVAKIQQFILNLYSLKKMYKDLKVDNANVLYKQMYDSYVQELNSMKMSKATILFLIRQMYGNTDKAPNGTFNYKRFRKMIISLIYSSAQTRKLLLECLMEKQNLLLKPCANGDVIIRGCRYMVA